MTTPPCKITWTGPDFDLPSPDGTSHLGRVTAGSTGVLVYPGLAAFSPDLALLYRVEEAHFTCVAPTSRDDLGGWDGTTITPTLIRTLLNHVETVPILVQVMTDDPDLGPKVVQGIMAGMS